MVFVGFYFATKPFLHHSLSIQYPLTWKVWRPHEFASHSSLILKITFRCLATPPSLSIFNILLQHTSIYLSLHPPITPLLISKIRPSIVFSLSISIILALILLLSSFHTFFPSSSPLSYLSSPQIQFPSFLHIKKHASHFQSHSFNISHFIFFFIHHQFFTIPIFSDHFPFFYPTFSPSSPSHTTSTSSASFILDFRRETRLFPAMENLNKLNGQEKVY